MGSAPRYQNLPTSAAQYNSRRLMGPRLNHTLIARLSHDPVMFYQTMKDGKNMKTVDQAVKDWKNQFSGDPTEDWINHVNDLDRELACKFSWTARQFYYALKGTLRSKASTSLSNLEKGLERPNIRDFIPEWHEPDPQEWRALHDGLFVHPANRSHSSRRADLLFPIQVPDHYAAPSVRGIHPLVAISA